MRLGVLERAQKDPGASTSTRWSGRSKGVAIVTAALLGAGGSILAAAPATAAPVASTGQGRFLSGSALGLNLDDILTVTPADAVNTGGATDTDVHPLDVTALNAVNVNLGGGLNLLGNNGILTLGAVNQYAAANADGSSVAASGAVTNTGGIGVGGQDGVPQSNATLDLSGLIGADLAGALANAQLEVGAVSATAAQAAGPDGAQTGDYGIAGLDLSLTSPALGTTVSGLRTTLGTLQPTVDGVEDTLNALGPLVQVQGLPDLVTVLDSATGDVTSADGSITANLQTGAITVDVAAVLTNAGLDINNLPANTELLPYITEALTTQLLPAVTTALQGVVTQLTQSLRGLTVTVAGLPLPIGQLLDVVNPVIAQVVAPINQVVAGLGETVITPLANALTTVVSLQANVQETSADGVFTQRALRVALVPAAGTAVVNLASAAVGPNAGPLAVPTITALDPDNGPVAGGTVVTVTGTGFTDDATVSVDGSDPIEADSVSDDGTELTFTTPAHVVGTVDVTVTTPAGESDPLDFTYTDDAAAVPTITTLDPDNGPVAGGTVVTVTGTGFTDDATVSVDGSDPIEADSVSDDGTELTFTTPAHDAGTVDVTVTTPAGTSDPLDYTYNPAPAAVPTLTTLDPDNGPVGGGTLVTVTGTGFTDDATVSVDGSDPIDPESVSDDGTELTFTTPAHVAGPVDVTVTTDAGTSEPLTYTYNPAPAGAPTLTALDPDNGPVTGGTVVTVSGTGFTDASTVSVDGSDPITPDSVSDDGTELTFTTPAHTAGAVPVTVTNGSGTSAPLPYTYNPAPAAVPTISALDPDNGPAAGGTVVTVTGTGFTDDSTVSVDGSDPITPDSVSADGTTLTFTTPAHAAGDVEVTVTTPGGTSDPLVYTYNPASTTTTPPPVITSPTDGGTVTTPNPPITGTGQPGATVTVTDGTVIVCTAVVAADGTWKCTPIVGFGPGTVTITATQTGADGTSAASDPVTFTVRLATAGTGGAGGTGPNGTLAYTGSDPAPVIAFAILLMLAGVGLTIARRFRRA
ncbi:choice-of-anchor G family protein [Curtobacterium sp. MWU13-2055]|uniref:choice-of-anchor G family protein n=1 Tax=Curtobacterium sp. MWU13-2055 TaxID=2931928 RepID=UPI00200D416F|nr:choice-of-anchor G family protein [Curtobacterium sp. MWU13-2055]